MVRIKAHLVSHGDSGYVQISLLLLYVHAMSYTVRDWLSLFFQYDRKQTLSWDSPPSREATGTLLHPLHTSWRWQTSVPRQAKIHWGASAKYHLVMCAAASQRQWQTKKMHMRKAFRFCLKILDLHSNRLLNFLSNEIMFHAVRPSEYNAIVSLWIWNHRINFFSPDKSKQAVSNFIPTVKK